MTISSVQFGNAAAMQQTARTAPMAQQQQATGLQSDTVMFGARSTRKAGGFAALLATIGLMTACGSQSEPINLEITKADGTTRSTTATVGKSTMGTPAVYASENTLWGKGDTELKPIFALEEDGKDIGFHADGDNIADVVPTGDNKATIRAEYENEDAMFNSNERKGDVATATRDGNKVVVTSMDGRELVTATIPADTNWLDVTAATVPSVIEALTGQQPQNLPGSGQKDAEEVLENSDNINADNLGDWAKYAGDEIDGAYQTGSVDAED